MLDPNGGCSIVANRFTRGFILQPTYRIESGRSVVWLYGRAESGESFLIRDSRSVPRFWVRRGDVSRARGLGGIVPGTASTRSTFDGEPAVAMELGIPGDAPALRDRLTAAGIPCFEADVRFAYRYLIDRRIRSCVEISGAARPGEYVDRVFDDPEVRPADWTPRLRVLSFDIETDPRARRLLSIGLEGCGASEVLLFTPRGYASPDGSVACASEREVLRRFVERVRQLDPDVLTGWNVIDFDLAVLSRLSQRLGVALTLGRDHAAVRLQPARVPRASSRVSLAGRVVLDGIDLLRGAYIKMDSYALNSVAREILGRGKTLGGAHRAEEILHAFKHHRQEFVEYNLNDCRLVLEILHELRLIELVVERCRLTGMPPDRVGASIASFDLLYLSELGRRRIVAPTVGGGERFDAHTSGGHVLEPKPGLYRNVLVLDFKSLYPSVIRTFQIDPLGYLPPDHSDADPIVAPNGAAFRRRPGILPALLDELFPRRQAAQAAGNAVASQAIKILMNSFYGVLGTPACRFASPALANAITGYGREILLWSRDRIESWGHEVLYGDTDSLFVRSGADDARLAAERGTDLVARLNRELAEHVRGKWRVESRLEMEFERLYLRLMLPAARHRTAGARKRYAGLIAVDGGTEVVFTGMEVVRRDWTELARQTQRELYRRLFADQPVEEYLRQVVADLRAGKLDPLLVYRKALRKKLTEYVAATPPHVAAARKMTGRPGRVVSYVVTVSGPESAAEQRSRIDHEHYVQKQIRAVAQPLLALLGLDFDRTIGSDSQLELF
jgi:DNA polymerase-2